ncbi:MAG: hypothetical protein QOG44_1314 [Acidimicrobiaceae bacterium]|jgi:hypothetical protein|nr:hypothetical protein [Acidimicrobiaceae bacterium]
MVSLFARDGDLDEGCGSVRRSQTYTAQKGFIGDLLDQVVDTIVSDRETCLATMMDEELHLQPVDALFHPAGG